MLENHRNKFQNQSFFQKNRKWLLPFLLLPLFLLAILFIRVGVDKRNAIRLLEEEKAQQSGTFTDSRDAQSYRWVRLKDGKKWMAQNLNFDIEGSWSYPEDSIKGYGRLYTWDAAMKACPKGWRIPSDEEWWDMTSHYGKARSHIKNNTGDEAGQEAFKLLAEGGSSGFEAKPAGIIWGNRACVSFGKKGSYWTDSEYGSTTAWTFEFQWGNGRLLWFHSSKRLGHSCRCFQD